MIYKGIELKCTQTEFEAFVAAIEVNSSVHQFTETFNGHEVENQTNDPLAKYYVMTIGDRTYLQAHVPFVSGFQAITIENASTIIEDHKAKVIDEMAIAHFAKTKDDEITELKAVIDMLVIDSLGGAGIV